MASESKRPLLNCHVSRSINRLKCTFQTIVPVLKTFLARHSALKCNVENEPMSSLIVQVEKAFNGIPNLKVGSQQRARNSLRLKMQAQCCL